VAAPRPYVLVASGPQVTAVLNKAGGAAPAAPAAPKKEPAKEADKQPAGNGQPPAPPAESGDAQDQKPTVVLPNLYVASLVLPDLERAYAVGATSGWGESKLDLTIVNGILTGVNSTADGKQAETVESVAALVTAIGSLIPGIGVDVSGGGAVQEQEFVRLRDSEDPNNQIDPRLLKSGIILIDVQAGAYRAWSTDGGSHGIARASPAHGDAEFDALLSYLASLEDTHSE